LTQNFITLLLELTKRYRIVDSKDIQLKFFADVQIGLIEDFLDRLKNLPWEHTFSVITCVREIKKLMQDWQDNLFFMELDEKGTILNATADLYKLYEDYLIAQVQDQCRQLAEQVVDAYQQQMNFGSQDSNQNAFEEKSLSLAATKAIQGLHTRLHTLECDLERVLASEVDKALTAQVFLVHKLGSSSMEQIKHDIDHGFVAIFIDYFPHPEALFTQTAEAVSILADRKLYRAKLASKTVKFTPQYLTLKGVQFLVS